MSKKEIFSKHKNGNHRKSSYTLRIRITHRIRTYGPLLSLFYLVTFSQKYSQ